MVNNLYQAVKFSFFPDVDPAVSLRDLHRQQELTAQTEEPRLCP